MKTLFGSLNLSHYIGSTIDKFFSLVLDWYCELLLQLICGSCRNSKEADIVHFHFSSVAKQPSGELDRITNGSKHINLIECDTERDEVNDPSVGIHVIKKQDKSVDMKRYCRFYKPNLFSNFDIWCTFLYVEITYIYWRMFWTL